MPDPMDRFECFKAIFGTHYATQLDKGGYRELWEACDQAEHPLMADMAPVQRERLRAVLRLAQLWYREQEWEPTMVTGIGDLVRLILPRLRERTDRVVWLIALDASNAVAAEVLVQFGGDPLAPPAPRALLRHALFKGAVSAWVADYRPVDNLEVTEDTATTFRTLAEVGESIGIAFRGWVLFAPGAVRSVAGQVPEGTSEDAPIQAAA